MTSPSQLQYLNAMGIPVWVSRELVIDKIQSDATIIDSKQVIASSTASSTPSTSNAVENILQGLDQTENGTKSTDNSALNKSPSDTIKQIIDTLDDKPATTRPVEQVIPNAFAKTAQHTIYAQGDLEADWMVLGQNPEFIEHEHGQPYAREEGTLLENMIRAIGVTHPRNDAYLVNVLRNNQLRDTDAAQSKTELNSILQDRIKQVQPKIIVIVGQLAAQNVLHSGEPLARLRGKPFILPDTNIHVVVTYYPSYLLSKPGDKRKAWEDLKLAMSLVTE